MQILWGFAQVSNFKKIAVAFCCLSMLALQVGCQRRDDSWKPGTAFRTQIIISKSFGTEFKQVELNGVFDKSTLEGAVVDYYFAPGDGGGRIIGNKPIASFIEDDGVYIPADQTSLQMVTLYYHLQQLKELELQATESEKSILNWPRKVALAVRVINSPDLRFDNAFYNGKLDALYFVPYKDSAFPIPLNPGIIGHEHFHSYFSYEVLQPLTDKKLLPTQIEIGETIDEKVMKDFYNLYVLKIINEGLADVWGWIYSEDPDFVAQSLPKVEQTRNLEKGTDTRSSRFATEMDLRSDVYTMIKTCIVHTEECHGQDPYGKGTVLARMIKSFSTAYKQSKGTSELATRKLMAAKILKLIRAVEKSFETGSTLTLDKVAILWEKQFDSLSESECRILKETANSPGDLRCTLSAPSPTP